MPSSSTNPVKQATSKYTVSQLLDKVDENVDSFQYEVADKFCERALEMDRDDLRAIETSGYLKLELGQHDTAIQLFERAVTQSPDKGHSKYMYLGQLYHGRDAVRNIERGIHILKVQRQTLSNESGSNVTSTKTPSSSDTAETSQSTIDSNSQNHPIETGSKENTKTEMDCNTCTTETTKTQTDAKSCTTEISIHSSETQTDSQSCTIEISKHSSETQSDSKSCTTEISNHSSETQTDTKSCDRDISNAYCSLAELYLTDLCMEEGADVKCKEHASNAIVADTSNSEAYRVMADCLMSLSDTQGAADMIKKSVGLWMSAVRQQSTSSDTTSHHADYNPTRVTSVPYQSRVNSAKILIELEEYELSSEVLELLLDENDSVTEVWYLLGWLNHLQGGDYVGNARFYLTKAHQVHTTSGEPDDQMIGHIQELLAELGPGGSDDEESDGDDICIESDSDSAMEES